MARDWTPTYSDEDFRRRLNIGARWAEYVADELRRRGHEVEVPPSRFRANPSEIYEFTRGDKDLIVDGRPVEVKARSVEFTCAADYPYPTALVDTVRRFCTKRHRPFAYMILSTYTQAIVWFFADPRHFTIKKQGDPARGITYDAYVIAKSYLRNLKERREDR